MPDGSSEAPAGAAQRANALDRYAVRPTWKVAGIDYAVGIPKGTVLKSPASITVKGVAVHTDTKRVEVAAEDMLLDAYDFSGWQVELLPGAGNLTITRSRFVAGPNQKLSSVYAAPGGKVTLTYNTFDGGGAASQVNPLFAAGTGGADVAYNVFRNVPNDAINITHDGVYTIQYNLFDSLNFGDGHTDCVQSFFTAITSLKVTYNTVYQPAPDASGFPGGGNSFVRVGDQRGKTVAALEIAHNTLIFRGQGTMRFANVFDLSVDGGAVLNPIVHDNFVDPTGILYGIWSPYHSELTNPVYYDNRDLSQDRPLRAGPYNSRTASVPSRSPASPVVTDVEREGDHVSLKGTATAGTRISLTTVRGPAGHATTGSDGTWRLAVTLPSSIGLIDVRAVDAWGNASSATSATLIASKTAVDADGRPPYSKRRR